MIGSLLTLVALNGPDGQVIYVNPAQILSVRAPRDYADNTVNPVIACAIEMSDGKFVNVIDNCEAVLAKIGARP